MSANNTWNEEKSEILNDEDLDEVLELDSISDEETEDEDDAFETSENIFYHSPLNVSDIKDLLNGHNGLHPNHARAALNSYRTPTGYEGCFDSSER